MSAANLSQWMVLGILLAPVIASALPPPKTIEEANLKAELIVAGEVLDVHTSVVPRHFVLQPIHVIKGITGIDRAHRMRVAFKPPPEPPSAAGLGVHAQGVLPVKVEARSVVIVFVKRSPDHPGYFTPMLEGLSVVTVGSPASKRP